MVSDRDCVGEKAAVHAVARTADLAAVESKADSADSAGHSGSMS